jgi:DUF4097 and DUF4098 domain-containing protein YvlB
MAILTFGSASIWADVQETETFSFELTESGRISLSNVNGDVQITGGSGDKVEITAVKSADNDKDLARLEVKIAAEADSIRIETVHGKSDSRWFGDNSGEVTYTLTVPALVNLDTISTVNGDVAVQGVSGTVNAESVNGELDLQNLKGDVDLETTNGGIEARFDTLAGTQRVSADTVNGRITLYLPADASARLSAETINGGINAEDFDLEVDSGGFVGKDLDGTIGSGEARINLDTVNGGIRVRKQS